MLSRVEFKALILSLIIIFSLIPIIDEQYPELTVELEKKEAIAYTTNWLYDGDFIDTDTRHYNSSLASHDIPEGVIIPKLRFESPSQWEFEEHFTNGPQHSWTCGGNPAQTNSGYTTITQSSFGNSYCYHLSPTPWISNGWSTLAQNISMNYISNSSYRSIKIGGVTNGETNWFGIVQEGDGKVVPFGEKDGFGIDCGPQSTSLPPHTAGGSNWIDWRVLVDHSNREYMLYQGAFLRCRLPFFAEKNPSEDYTSFNAHSNGTLASASYDDMRASGGRFAPFSSGTWVSPPLEKDPDYEWGSLDLDWQWYGIGNFQDVRETIRLTVLDWRDNTPIEGFTNLRPTSNMLNISSIPHNIPLKIQIDWLPNITADLIALSAVNYQDGELRPLDLEMDSLSASGANSVAPIILRSEFYAHRMQGYQRDIDIGVSIDNGRNYSTTFNSSVIDSMHWGGWFNENYSALPAGLYNLTVTLDPNNEWAEENEDNNQFTASFSVSPSAGPNITLVNNPDVGEQAIFAIEPIVEGLQIEYMWLQWDFGDGELIQIPYQSIITHTYDVAGNHSLSLFAFHQGNQTTSFTIFDFQIGNTPPIANISVSQPWPALAQVVRLSCENSTDSPGEVLICEWLIEEGLPLENQGQWIVGETIIHRYPSLGEKHVTLRVTDPFGASDVVEANFTLEVQETRQLLIGVETNSSAVFEGTSIMVRPILNPDLNASEQENISLAWMQEGVGVLTTKNATGWYPLSVGIENGLNAGAVLSQLQVGLETEYDLTNFYYSVLNRPPEIFVQNNIADTLYEDEQFIIDWSGSIDDEWDSLSATISFEPNVEATIIEDKDLKKFVISIPKSATYQMTVEISDGSDTDSLTIPIIVVNKQPEIKVECTSKPHGEIVDVLCLIVDIDESPSDIDTLSISWDSPWVQRIGMEFEVLGIEPGNPSRGENEYVIYYEVVDDDGARSNGTVYVQINTTSKSSFGSIFEFNVLKFPLFAFLGMFIIGGLLSYISSRKKPNEVGSKEWFKQNPWSQELNQSEKIIPEEAEENIESDD